MSAYMKLKELILTSILVVSSTSMDKHTYIQKSKEDMVKVLSEMPSKEAEQPVFYKFDISEDLLDALHAIDPTKSSEVIFSREIEDLKDTPLFMKWTKRDIGEFLGYNQYDAILKKYNKDTLAEKENRAINALHLKEVSFPLVYDGLVGKIPDTIQELLCTDTTDVFEKYKDRLHIQDTLIVVNKQDDGRHAISYYVWGNLFLASYISLGLWHYTPQWLFTIQDKIFDKRSIKYKSAPMPYALHIHKNIFIHQWTANGQKKSHGCVRVPWLYQEVLYYHTKVGTKVLILP